MVPKAKRNPNHDQMRVQAAAMAIENAIATELEPAGDAVASGARSEWRSLRLIRVEGSTRN
jgi:hypothetical protein